MAFENVDYGHNILWSPFLKEEQGCVTVDDLIRFFKIKTSKSSNSYTPRPSGTSLKRGFFMRKQNSLLLRLLLLFFLNK